MSWSRKKSCSHCRASKARCNKAYPQCSRCTERGLDCLYEGRFADRVAPYEYQPRVATSLSALRQTPSSGYSDVDFIFDGSSLETADQLPDMDDFLVQLDNTQGLQLDWTHADTAKVFPLVNEASLSNLLDHDPWIATSDIRPQALPRQPLTISTAGLQQQSFQRTLMRRGPHSRCPLTSMVLGQVMSYPKYLLEGDQLPPFIHPPCHLDEELAHDCLESDSHVCLPKRLATCASLVRMFYNRTTADEEFVWDTIRGEVDRIKHETSINTISKDDQLHALQSMAVLLLLQAEAPETAARNGASQFLETIMNLIMQITAQGQWDKDLPIGRPDRKEWVWRESLRRVISLLSVIDLLLEGIMSATTTFRHDFSDVPLPASRNLWNARTNRRWRTAYDQYSSGRRSDRLLRVSDLIESDEAGCFSKSAPNVHATDAFADVIKWCEGSDTLGTLVWMAMPFEQHRRRNVQ